jgi:hypothetical protein
MTLLMYFSLPSALFIITAGSSLAMGLMVALTLLTFLVAVRTPIPLRLNKPQVFWLSAAALSISLLLPWSTPVEVSKQIGAILAIALAFAMTNVLVWYYHDKPVALRRMVAVSFAAFVVIALANRLVPITPGRYALLNHPIFPFGEPSHFSLALFPILLTTSAIVHKSTRVLIILGTMAMAVLLPSTTLALVAVITGMITVSRKVLIMLPVGLMLLAGAVALAPGYFKERILLDTESENLSALIYLQGLLAAQNGVLDTHGMGFGFQRLGTEPPNEATEVIEIVAGNTFNRLDGGFLAAKIVAEFGVVGIAMLAWATFVAIRALIQLAELYQLALHERRQHMWLAFGLAARAAILLELYVRGYGYFSPGFLLFMSSFSFIGHSPRRAGPCPNASAPAAPPSTPAPTQGIGDMR